MIPELARLMESELVPAIRAELKEELREEWEQHNGWADDAVGGLPGG